MAPLSLIPMPTRSKEKRSAYNRAYREKMGPEWERARNLRKSYGIGISDFEAMYASCKGRCESCSKELKRPREGKKTDRAQIDHDHVSGRVCGLLCTNCNIALGHLQESPAQIRRLLTYAIRRKSQMNLQLVRSADQKSRNGEASPETRKPNRDDEHASTIRIV
jgi:hypothetical protein